MEELLNISTDNSLRETVLLHLQICSAQNAHPPSSHVSSNPLTVTNSQSDSPAVNPLAASVRQSGSTNSPLATSVHQFGTNINSPLAASVHQPGVNMDNPLAADVCQVGDNYASNPREGHQMENDDSVCLPSDFDQSAHAIEDEHTFPTQSLITEYPEKHFHRMLDKASRLAMHKTHPVPKTMVTKAPKVDHYVMNYLKSCFPKGEDAESPKI